MPIASHARGRWFETSRAHLFRLLQGFDGLALVPYDAELQQSLAAARAAIPYPEPLSPAERVRPDPVNGLRNRVAPWDLYRLAAVSVPCVLFGPGSNIPRAASEILALVRERRAAA